MKSLSAKLMIFFLLMSIIPMVIIGVVTYIISSTEIEHLVINEEKVFNALTMDTMRTFFVEREEEIVVLGHLNRYYSNIDVLADKTGTDYQAAYDAVDSFTKIVMDAYGHLNLMLMDKEGNIVYSASPEWKDDNTWKEEDYAKRVMKSGTTDYGEFRIDDVTQKSIIDVAGPVINVATNTIEGYIVIVLDGIKLAETLNYGKEAIGASADVYMVNKSNKLLTDTMVGNDAFEKTIDTKLTQAIISEINKGTAEFEFSGVYQDYRGTPVVGTGDILTVGEHKYVLITELDESEAMAAINRLLWIVIGVVLGAAAVVAVVAFLIARTIVRPIKSIGDMVEAIVKGDFSKKADVKSKDEIGQMSASLNDMLNGVIGEGQSLKNGISDPFFMVDKDLTVKYANDTLLKLLGFTAEEVTGKMKCKDLMKSDICDSSCAIKAAMEKNIAFSGVKVKIKSKDGRIIPVSASAASLKDLNGVPMGGYEILRDITVEDEISRTVAEVTEQVTSAANEIASSSEEMATGSEQQSRQTTEVATAMEEMTETILETSKNAEAALKAANEANKASAEGGKIIDATIESIKSVAASTKEIATVLNDLSAKSEQIGDVVNVIDDIAEQTNLLALNAAIEAARAGEHGRGFAVVADEVRKLAERTLKTTKEVTSTVKAMQQGTKDTVEVVKGYAVKTDEVVVKANEATVAFNSILQNSQKVNDITSQVATAADEQSSAAEEISKNIESVASVTKQVTNGAKQAATAALQLDKLAKELSDVVAKLN